MFIIPTAPLAETDVPIAIEVTNKWKNYQYTSIKVCTCNSCNMGTRDLSDMYVQSLRQYILVSVHVTANMYHFHFKPG